MVSEQNTIDHLTSSDIEELVARGHRLRAEAIRASFKTTTLAIKSMIAGRAGYGEALGGKDDLAHGSA